MFSFITEVNQGVQVFISNKNNVTTTATVTTVGTTFFYKFFSAEAAHAVAALASFYINPRSVNKHFLSPISQKFIFIYSYVYYTLPLLSYSTPVTQKLLTQYKEHIYNEETCKILNSIPKTNPSDFTAYCIHSVIDIKSLNLYVYNSSFPLTNHKPIVII